jgi:threonine synthase
MRPGHLALREPTLWRYRDVLPVEDPDDRVSLGEGFTPLLPAPRLAALVARPTRFIKDESGNPTGSFKARGLSLAVSMAKALGARAV